MWAQREGGFSSGCVCRPCSRLLPRGPGAAGAEPATSAAAQTFAEGRKAFISSESPFPYL